jgi:hypothetical protein
LQASATPGDTVQQYGLPKTTDTSAQTAAQAAALQKKYQTQNWLSQQWAQNQTLISIGGGALVFFAVMGLSNDSRLAYYLQNLTPAQLQTALDGGDINQSLIELLHQDLTGTGAGWLPCGGVNNPTCGPAGGPDVGSGNSVFGNLPSGLMLIGCGLIGLVALGAVRR